MGTTKRESIELVNRKLIYTEIWQPSEINPMKETSIFDGHIIVFDWDTYLFDLLKNDCLVILVMPGSTFRKIEEHIYEINIQKAEDYESLFGALNDKNIQPQTLLHFWSKPKMSLNHSIDELLSISIDSLFYVAKTLINRKINTNISLLYFHQGSLEEMEPQYGAVAGFLRSLSIEMPSFLVKSIGYQEIGTKEMYLQLIEQEIKDPSNIDIFYDHQFVRYIRAYQPYKSAHIHSSQNLLKNGGIYLITGGAGNIGIIMAGYLLSKVKCNIILTGRSTLSESKKEKLHQLEQEGSTVIYVESDITNKESIQKLIVEIKKRYGSVDGIIHSAGVLRDGFLFKKTKEDFDTVLAPKIYGTYWLDELTKDEALDFFVLFSSISAVLGNVGQTDYAYANGFMDYYVKKRERLVQEKKRHGHSISINWPYWLEGGMTIDEKTIEWLKENRGLYPLTNQHGIEAFEVALNGSANQILVFEGDEMKINGLLSIEETDKLLVNDDIKTIENASTIHFLKQLLSKETKLPLSRIDPEADFEKYGLDSVMVMNLNRELESYFGELPKTLLYEYQTLKALVEYLENNYVEILNKKLNKDNIISSNTNRSSRRQRLAQKVEQDRLMKDDLQYQRLSEQDDIAIIGLSGQYPMAKDVNEFWENLKSRRDCITEIPASRWDFRQYFDENKNVKGKTYSKWGGFIDDVDCFDPLFFNISPKDARYMDPQERIFLQTAWHVLEDAAYTRERLSKDSVGVFVGVMFGHYQLFGVEEAMKGNNIGLSSSFSSIANRVSFFLNLKGPSIAVDTMCSSSLTAIHMAKESILRGECEVAIAGGVNLTIHPNKYILLSQSNFPSSDGKCRSFGEGGDGYVPGEGTGAVLLKSLSKALEDGDHIYGIIKSSVLNHGGKTSGYSVPNPIAQADLIIKAIKKAGFNPRTISYIEAHGTGTALGDPIEITGLTKAFEESANEKQYCAIGSVKSNIGHLESAAGIAGLTKVLLQMKHQLLVPSIHSETLNKNIKFEGTPFFVQRKLEEWHQPIVDGEIFPRRAGISSFGAGGSNAHILLEEYINEKVPQEYKKEYLIVLSARNEECLKTYARVLNEFLSGLSDKTYNQKPTLAQIAYTLQIGREAMPFRLAFVVSSIQSIKEKLNQYIAGNQGLSDIYIGEVEEINTFTETKNVNKTNLNNLLDSKQLDKLGKLWVDGTDFDWELLYDKKMRSVSLPGYPFIKERYWVPKKQESSISIASTNAKLHPLLDKNISTINEQKFTTYFSKETFFIQDHIVNGSVILPGVTYIEMARAAGEWSGITGNIVLQDIQWIRPIVIKDNICVNISLFPEEDYFIYEVSTGKDEAKVVHGQGRIIEKETKFETTDRVSIDMIKERCTKYISDKEVYQQLNEAGFTYGDSFKTIREVFIGNEELLAKLELSTGIIGTLKDYKIHPSIADGALQAVSGLTDNKEGTMLPFELGEVEVFSSLKEVCYAYVQTTFKSGQIQKYNIQVIDNEGITLMRLKDFSLRLQNSNGYEVALHQEQYTKEKVLDHFIVSEGEFEGLLTQFQNDLVQEISKIIMMNTTEIDVNKVMSKYGFDSITFTELSNKLNEKYKMHVMPSLFYEHESIMSVSHYLLRKYKILLLKYYKNLLPSVEANKVIEDQVNYPQKSSEGYNHIQNRHWSFKKYRTNPYTNSYNEPIAIIGISGVMPGAEDLKEFWDNLESGKSLITEIPRDRWDFRLYYGDPMSEAGKTNVKWGGFMKEVDKFDPRFFEISPREAELMDPQQRIFLQTAWKAIEDAGYNPADLSGTKTGVFVGVGTSDYSELLKEKNIEIKAQNTTGLSHCIIPNRISYLLNLHGPSEPIDTACSSSLVAVHRAVEAIQLGNCEMAIAGGVSVIASPDSYIALSKAAMICEDGRCKTFDKKANGYVRGEGSGAILLKPLAKAIEANDHIYAVIKGSDVNHGGHVNSITTPNPNAQAEVIVNAWRKANVDPSTITYIEAHGSGTSLGDPIEINGLKKAFLELYKERSQSKQLKGYCGLGSVKSNIGHLETAAGIAGLMKVILAMKEKKIPATINFDELNPYIELEGSPFYIAEDLRIWEKVGNCPRRAGVSSFGFGGTNAHIALEEFERVDRGIKEDNQPQLIILSAKNKASLQKYVHDVISYLDNICSGEKSLSNHHSSKDHFQLDLIEIIATKLMVSKEEISLDESLEDYGYDPIQLHELIKDLVELYDFKNVEMPQGYLSIHSLTQVLYKQNKTAIDTYYHKPEIVQPETNTEFHIEDFAYTLQVGREAMSERLAVIVAEPNELRIKLNLYLEGQDNIDQLYYDSVKENGNKAVSIIEGKEGEQFITALISERKLDKLAKLWVSGVKINWRLFYKYPYPRRIPLPTYPFSKERYWLPENIEIYKNSQGDLPVKIANEDIKDKTQNKVTNDEVIYYTNTWSVCETIHKTNKESNKVSRLLIFDTDKDLFDQLKKEENSTYQQVILVQPGEGFADCGNSEYYINPLLQDDYAKLFEQLKSKEHMPSNLVYLWCFKNYSINDYTQSIESSLHKGIYPIFHVCQVLTKFKWKDLLHMVIMFNQENNVTLPLNEAISGFLKTVTLENSKITYQSIEVDQNKQEVKYILEHLFTDLNGFKNSDFKMKDSKYYIKHLIQVNEVPIDAQNIFTTLKEEGVYIITGGAGGLGLIFAKYLAQKYKAKLILTGRSNLNASIQNELNCLNDYGAEAIYISTNISEKEEVKKLIKVVKDRFAQINGIIHSAGVIKDQYLIHKTINEMEDVFKAKIFGTVWLDGATQGDPLDFFAVFSSLAAVVGNPGQSDYAYANHFMDSFISQRALKVALKERYGKSISINWPLWKDGRMHVNHQVEVMMEKNIGIIPLRTQYGIDAFEHAFSQSSHQLIVLRGNKEKIQNVLENKAANHKVYNKRIDVNVLLRHLQEELIQIVSNLLKIPLVEIHLEEDMSQYGFDSITFIEFANQLNEKYGVPLLPSIFYEHPNLFSFSRHIIQEYKDIMTRHYVNEKGAEDEFIQISPLKEVKMESYSEKMQPDKESIRSEVHDQKEPIAIIGLSGVFPQSSNLEEFWENLIGEKDLITEIPKERWDWKAYYGNPLRDENKTNIKWGGFMKNVDKFDPLFFGISPREAELMDPQQRILLEMVWTALEDAGYRSKDLSGTNTGVFIGVGNSDYSDLIKEHNIEIQAQISTGLSHSVLANRVSYLLNLHGPSEPIDTACSSSLTAVHRAIEAIQLGHCDMAIAGGVSVLASPTPYIALSKAGMLSEDGRCKTFDKDANGYVRGEGVGVVFLRPLSKAVYNKDHIYAVIKGSAVNHGGHVNSLTTPNPNAQAEVIQKAWNKAQINPSLMDYIEAHGTGTSLGDPIEINGLKKAFELSYKKWGIETTTNPHCGIGSIKTNIGHLEAAAGIAGLIKVALSLKHKKIPASIHCNELNPYIQLENSPLYIVNTTKDWIKNEGKKRIAGVSSFGYAGTNAHIVLEEYNPPIGQTEDNGSHIIVLSAKSKSGLSVYVEKMVKFLEDQLKCEHQISLGDFAYTLQVGRDPMPFRLSVVASSLESLLNKLMEFANGETSIEDLYVTHLVQDKTGILSLLNGEAGQIFVQSVVEKCEYSSIAKLWVNGYEIDWHLLKNAKCFKRVSLPTYPFERESYWLPKTHNCSNNKQQDGLLNLLKGLESGEVEVDDAMGIDTNVFINS